MNELTRTRRPGDGEASPASKRRGRAAGAPVIVTPVPATGHGPLQRLPHCACGGGCPRCREEAHPAVQTKLTVSQPGDMHEQEADRVAEQVMRMPLREPERVGRHAGPPPALRGKCGACAEEEEGGKVFRREGGASAAAHAPGPAAV